MASAIYVEVVPSDLTLGNALSDKARVTSQQYAKITAYPKTEIDAVVAKWEKKVGNGSWEKLDNSGNTLSVQGVEKVENGHRVAPSIFIRVTFGKSGGVLKYHLEGGSPSISDQSYDTDKAFNLSSTVPTKSGNVFVGWGNGSASTLSYQPGGSVSFSEMETNLYAIWYQTPQSITDIRHWDETADAAYTGDTATVSAQVSDIQRTGTPGKLTGKLTWTVTMPETPEISEYPKFVKIAVGSDGDVDNVLTSTEEINTDGSTVSIDSAFQVSSDWMLTVYYSNGDLVAVFHPNGGIPGPTDLSFKEGEPFKIPLEKPTRAGYVFCGWAYDDSNASPTDPDLIQPGSEFTGSGFELWDNCTFYAVWKPGVELTVIYHNVTTGQNSDEPLSNATVWATADDGKIHWTIDNVVEHFELVLSGTLRATDSEGTVIGSGNGETGEFEYHNTDEEPSSSWVATINYKQDAFRVTYNTQGGNPAIAEQVITVDKADSVTVSTIRPKKRGYTFLGWSEDASADRATIQPGAKIALTGDITLYAIYEKNGEESSDSSDESSQGGGGGEGSDTSPGEEDKFTVYGRPDDAKHGTVTPSEKVYEEGDQVSFTASAKSGYKFSYWMDAEEGVSISTSATYTFTGTESLNGHTFVAMFTQLEETIPTELIYYVPTDLLMSAGNTLIWNDDGLKGCGDGEEGGE